MSFWRQFLALIFLRPHRLFISLFWLWQGKIVRARNKLGILDTLSIPLYRKWIAQVEPELIATALDNDGQPEISFCIAIGKTMNTQTYHNWVFATDPKATSADYIVWVPDDVKVPPYALTILAHSIQKWIDDTGALPDAVYSDHDFLVNGNRMFGYFKGDFDPVLLQNSDYLQGLCAVRADLVKNAEHDFTWQGRYDLFCEIGNNDEANIVHVPYVLLHQHWLPKDIPCADYLQKTISDTTGRALNETGFAISSSSDLDKEPLVSILIPTRDMLYLLRGCITSILSKTTYQNYEIVILDNESINAETHAYFEMISKHEQVRIISCPGAFNYSAINNRGVSEAKGDYICLLNNDTEVISGQWLSDMVLWAVQGHVGAVGAKLLYADHTIQHAGVHMGVGGVAGHGHRFLPQNKAGYFYQAHLPQQVMGVTAACLLVSKDKYQQVGGLDDLHLSVAFNDVDFCLKLDKAGLKNIYEPAAVLYHYESKSRGKDIKGEKKKRYLKEVEMMRQRWHTDVILDRYYNSNLRVDREDFSVNLDL